MNEELNKCPHCGKVEKLNLGINIIRIDAGYQMLCICGARGQIRKSQKEAISAWNTRPNELISVEEVIKNFQHYIDISNGVTAPYRHGNKPSKKHIDWLIEEQIKMEHYIKNLPSPPKE